MGQGGGLKNIHIIGRIGAPFGVKGWVHVQSFTHPKDNILAYRTWYFNNNFNDKNERQKQENNWHKKEILEIKPHGKDFVALLSGIEDRDQASKLTLAEFGIPRNDFKELEESDHYWVDLEGLSVINENNIKLGVVKNLFETGANDVLVVSGENKEHLIPFVMDQYILSIDYENKLIKVNWDENF